MTDIPVVGLEPNSTATPSAPAAGPASRSNATGAGGCSA